jgi:hypothetical protein
MVQTLNSHFSPISFLFFFPSSSFLTLSSTSYSVWDSLRKP